MCLSTIALVIVHGLVSFVSEVLHRFQNAIFRNIFGLAFIIPLLLRSRFAGLCTEQIGVHALRGVINIAAMLIFFTALSMAPLAKVTALNFTAPIFFGRSCCFGVRRMLSHLPMERYPVGISWHANNVTLKPYFNRHRCAVGHRISCTLQLWQ